MSTVAIVVIVVIVVLVLVGLFLMVPRARKRARVKKQERELRQRREQVVSEHREEAEDRERHGEEAERRARIAEREAQRERAEAQLLQEKAALHERGMADHELVGEHEREDFAGTSAVPDSTAEGGAVKRTEAYEEGAKGRSRSLPGRGFRGGAQTRAGVAPVRRTRTERALGVPSRLHRVADRRAVIFTAAFALALD